MSTQDVDKELNAIVRLFCCLHDRDMFIKSLEIYLHQRLLNKTVASKEAEEQIIAKIQMEQGFGSVQKMVGMFKDIELSKDMLPTFQSNRANQVAGIELQSVQVLTQGTWPMQCSDIPTCQIPPIMKELSQKFERFYKASHHNKNLNWLTQYGTVEVQPVFKQDKPYQLIVNVFQAAILNCYNENDVMSYSDLHKRTLVPTKQLNGCLFALCKPNVNLLTKQKKNSKFDDPNETFTLNLNWKNASIKVKLVPVASAKKSVDQDKGESEKLAAGVLKERTCVVQGNIVKIMKTNKDSAVDHKDLIQRTMEMCRLFKAQPELIKKCIEDLIQLGYIRRDEKIRSKYWYIA